MSLSNVQLQRANDLTLAADRVLARAKRLHVEGKDYDPGDFIPTSCFADALDELEEEGKVSLHAHLTRTRVLEHARVLAGS